MGGDRNNPKGYVIQLYQYAIRYAYNNDQFISYFNGNIDDKSFKDAQNADYLVLGDFDLIEINQVVGSLYIMKRRAHNESKTCNMDTVFVHAGCFQYSMRRAPCVVSEGVSVEGDGGAQPPQYPVASFREWLGPEKPHFS